MKKGEGGRGRGGRAGMRHGEDEEEEGGGRKGGRKARMMIRIMASWALGIGRRRGETGKRRRRRNAARALSFRGGT